MPADAIIARLFVYFELRLRLSTLAATALADNLSKNRQSDLVWRDGAKIETCRPYGQKTEMAEKPVSWASSVAVPETAQ